MSYFNVRVYGLLLNDSNEVLISDEQEYGMQFSKFPGGGLEIGEGLIDGLKREFIEECNLDIEILAHFYTTDFYERSVFNESQVLSVYYLVKESAEIKMAFKTNAFDFDTKEEPHQSFRWVSLKTIMPEDVTFKTDKAVVSLLIEKFRNS
ncbi:MAG: NUDIX domain-containing protein [Pedobacter sp.]|nr:MAG: NUDIX domain-containing protein [Pedobacter sp.]